MSDGGLGVQHARLTQCDPVSANRVGRSGFHHYLDDYIVVYFCWVVPIDLHESLSVPGGGYSVRAIRELAMASGSLNGPPVLPPKA